MPIRVTLLNMAFMLCYSRIRLMRLVREMMCIVYCKATKKKRQTQQADNIENCYEMDFQLFA